MESVDIKEAEEFDEEHMFLRDVIQEEHELLFLDSYLRESFGPQGGGHGLSGASNSSGPAGVFEEEAI